MGTPCTIQSNLGNKSWESLIWLLNPMSLHSCRMHLQYECEVFHSVQVVLTPSINNLHTLLASKVCPSLQGRALRLAQQGRNLSHRSPRMSVSPGTSHCTSAGLQHHQPWDDHFILSTHLHQQQNIGKSQELLQHALQTQGKAVLPIPHVWGFLHLKNNNKMQWFSGVAE